jgi:hypothetical protein
MGDGMRRHSIRAGIVMAALTASGFAQAAALDDRTSLICALVDLHSCGLGEACHRESAAALNLPPMVKIDITAKTIIGQRIDGPGQTTPIGTVQHNDQGLVLQGIDGQRSWNAVIDDDGGLSLAAVGPDGAFLIFGACAAP